MSDLDDGTRFDPTPDDKPTFPDGTSPTPAGDPDDEREQDVTAFEHYLPWAAARPRERKMDPLLVAVLVALGALVLLMLLGSVLTVGDHLAAASPVLAVVFYAIVVFLLVIGVGVPVAHVLAHPVFGLWQLYDEGGKVRRRVQRKLSANIAEARALNAPGEDAVDYIELEPRQIVDAFLTTFEPRIDSCIVRAARTTFFVGAVNRSPVISMATMASTSFNLVRDIVVTCGFRPTNAALMGIYARVMGSALIAGGIEDMDLDDLTGSMLGDGGAAKMGGMLIGGAANGITDAFLVSRVGVITKRELCSTEPPERRTLRKGSYAEALRILKSSGFTAEVTGVMRRQGAAAASAAGNAIKEGAIGAGVAIKEGAIEAGNAVISGVAGAGAAIRDVPQATGTVLRTVIKAPLHAGRTLVDGGRQTLGKAADGVIGTGKGILEGIAGIGHGIGRGVGRGIGRLTGRHTDARQLPQGRPDDDDVNGMESAIVDGSADADVHAS